MALNDELADALIGHQIGLQRLSNATVRKIVALLNRVDARVVERLLRADLSALSKQRQEKLLSDVRKIIESVYEDATGALRIELNQLAQYEGEYQLDLFKRLVPVQIDYVTPSPTQIVAAVNARPFQGRLLREWYKDIEAATQKRIRDSIRMGIVEGRTTDQMVRDIRGTRANGYKDGIIQTTRRNTEAVVRTAVNHTATAARQAFYEGNTDVIKGVQWTSTLDGRTSAVCRGRDGTVYPVDKGPRPPAHINCRSTVVPVTKSWAEMGIKLGDAPQGTRASMNGQVSADQTYSDWLRKQPVAFQDDVLGESKGRLFRKGGLSLDRFIDRAGREYTLDELKRRERDAWAAAYT